MQTTQSQSQSQSQTQSQSQMTESPLAEIRIGQITAQWAENRHLFSNYKVECTSTSDLAKNEAFIEPLPSEALCLYVTDHQTAGRGRGKNSWIDSQHGSSLLSSWSFLMKSKPQPTTSCQVGLALYRACLTTWPFLNWNLKAPNDIYINDKKVAGILLESLIQGEDIRLIIGIGLNLTSSPSSVTNSSSVVQELPPGAPLLGEDYLAFLDRLLFELTEAVSFAHETLNPTQQLSLLTALNKHPLLKEKYTAMESDGSLLCGEKKINWSSL